MDVRDLLLAQYNSAHEILDGVIAGCDDELLHYLAPGAANNPIGATFAHVFLTEDHIVNTVLRGGVTIFESDGWQARTGVPPQEGIRQPPGWSTSFQLDLDRFRPYADAVRESTRAFLTTATDADLDREVGTRMKMPVAVFFGRVALGHISGHGGEIAALKGVAGLKGMPF